jgi:hypothetical protein
MRRMRLLHTLRPFIVFEQSGIVGSMIKHVFLMMLEFLVMGQFAMELKFMVMQKFLIDWISINL